jgi:hypothetical protein
MTRLEFEQLAAATRQSRLEMEDLLSSAEKLAALAQFIRTGVKVDNWDQLFPMPGAAPAPSSGGGGGGGNGGGVAPAAQSDNNLGNGTAQTPVQAVLSSLGVNPAAAGISGAQYVNSNRGEPPRSAQQIIGPAPARVVPSNPMQQPRTPVTTSAQAAPRLPSGARYVPRGGPQTISSGGMIVPKRMAMGGSVKGYPMGGLIPYKAEGGFFKSLGSDTVPAMLTPGEFVIRRPAVSKIGVDRLEQINRGTYSGGSVYNYNLSVNVKSNADPEKIARTVIAQIKQVDNQRIRGNKL